MKCFNLYFSLLTTLLLLKLTATGQITNNPYVRETDVPNCKITKVEISPKSTTIDILYQKTQANPNQTWVSINSNMYIIDKSTHSKYKILGLADGLALDTQYPTTGKVGMLYNLTLVFPSIPSGLETFSLVEFVTHGTGFIWDDVKIDNPDRNPTTSWTEDKLKSDWNINKLDNLEGIYESTTGSSTEPKYRVALRKSPTGYDLIYLDGAMNEGRWKEGDIKAQLNETAKAGVYQVKWYMIDKSISENLYITFDNGLMNIIWTDGGANQVYLKLYPTASGSANTISGSGTGFALSNGGLIVTNYHVINGSSHISVKGINGDFNASYEAKVVLSDKNNDLAIIKIDDIKYHGITSIPYHIASSSSNVGESVFALGYPLRATMGDEIKLTNGIISSKTGYQGDITSYQISVPIQPGNSGGPLFNDHGEIIGVVNARLTNAEEVSYAVKASYLRNLIDLLPEPVVYNHTVVAHPLSLSNEVEAIKNYVYIIETN